MSNTCETVTIETENGPVIINKSDFDESIHTLATELKEGSKEWLVKQLESAGFGVDPASTKAQLQAMFDGLGK